MKKCNRCGAIQDDRHYYCIDCNNRLGPSLSKEEEAIVNNQVKKSLEKLSNNADYFYVSKIDKAVILSLCILSFLHILLMVIRAGYYRGNGFHALGFIIVLISVITAIDLRFPRISWELYKLRFILAIENPDDMTPSGFMLWSRRFFSKIILLIVLVALIVLFIASFNKINVSDSIITDINPILIR